jgi:hypothetical protein
MLKEAGMSKEPQKTSSRMEIIQSNVNKRLKAKQAGSSSW